MTAQATDPGGSTVTYTFKDSNGNAVATDTSGLFTVEASSGIVSLARATTASDIGNRSATVFASDGLLLSTSGLAFTVSVTNVAPGTPTDSNSAANTVTEATASGTAVGVTAQASDPGGSTVTYSFKDTNGNAVATDTSGLFKVASASGIVTLARATAASDIGNRSATVFASDGSLLSSSGLTFTVSVTNLAPNTPTDGNNAANTVTEATASGTAVGVTAQATDSGGSTVTYTFKDSNDNAVATDTTGLFKVASATGEVTLARATTASDIGNRSATVFASDGSLLSTSGLAFTVSVTNVAPGTPTDSNSAANTVTEATASGATVGVTAQATDPGGSTVTYSFKDSNGNAVDTDTTGLFKVASATGEVTLARATTGSDVGNRSATVFASDGSLLSTSGLTFTVSVTNLAPGTPTDSDSAANTVTESAASGTAVGVTAQASDPGGSTVTYTFKDSNGNAVATDTSGLFKVAAATGIVTLARATTGSDVGNRSATVFASDGSLLSTSGLTFTVSVTNLAPGTPTDSDSAANTVTESAASGTAVGVTAQASDPGGSTVTYSFKDSNGNAVATDTSGLFKVAAATGIVTLARATTASDIGNRSATVFASDGSLLSASGLTFTVSVSNGAPGTPTDSNSAANTVTEAAASGTAVGVTAQASDPGGSTVTYTFKDSNGNAVDTDTSGLFQVASATGIVTLARATTASDIGNHSATVFASDGSLLSASGLTFTVSVTNLAPGTPTDSNSSASTVTEATASGAVVGVTAQATDPGGSTVTYSFKDSNGNAVATDTAGLFTVASATGVVTLARATIGTDVGNRSATVFASDGTLFSSSGLTFTVTVTNLAPSTPTDSNSAVNTITEAAGSGTAVGVTAQATDPGGSTVTYTFTDSNGNAVVTDTSGLFQVASATGVVTLARAATFSDLGTRSATVFASDGTSLSAAGLTFAVDVTNLPPGIPTDSTTAANAVNEGSPAGTSVNVKASATDPGGATVSYFFLDADNQRSSNDVSGLFTITSGTGEIALTRAVTAGDRGSKTCVVYAWDGALLSTSGATFTIDILNLPPPSPGDADATANQVAEGTAPGVIVGVTAAATDAGGSTVTFGFRNSEGALVADDGNLFAIDQASGVVSLRRTPLATDLGPQACVVWSFDGTAQSTAATSFTITILDAPPALDPFVPATVSVPEGSLAGTQLRLCAGSDPGQASLTFAIAGVTSDVSEASALFRISGNRLELARKALHARLGTYTVQVTTSDGRATSPAQAVVVTIVPQPPSAPSDNDADAGTAGIVAENQPVGTVVGITLSAIDPGESPLTYALLDDAGGAFAIDAVSGVISTARVLDFEAISGGSLTVSAEARTATQVSASASFSITVTDRDDAQHSLAWPAAGSYSAILVDASQALAVLPTDWADPDGIPAEASPFSRINGWQATLAVTANFSSANDALLVSDSASAVVRVTGNTCIRASDSTPLATFTVAERSIAVTFTPGLDASVPLITEAEINDILGRLAFRTSGTQVLTNRPDLAFTLTWIPPSGRSDADGATLVNGALVVNQSNQRPQIRPFIGGSLAGPTAAYPVDRPGFLDLTANDLRIADDHPELGYTLSVVFPPSAGTLVAFDGSVETPLSAGGTTLTIAPAALPAFTLRYKATNASSAIADSCVVQLIDKGPSVPLASELVVLRFSLSDRGGYRPSNLLAVAGPYAEDGGPIFLADPAQVSVNGLTEATDVLSGGPWDFAVGSVTQDPLASSIDEQQVLALARGPQLIDERSDGKLASNGVIFGSIDGTANGTGGQALVIHLELATNLAQLKRLLASIIYRTGDQRMVREGSQVTLSLGFRLPGGTSPSPIDVVVQRSGQLDGPSFAVATTDFKLPRGARITGSSVVYDVDSLLAPSVESDDPALSVGTPVALGYDVVNRRYRFNVPWEVTVPTAAEEVNAFTLTVKDREQPALFDRQKIQISNLGEDGAIQFISDPPMFQRLGQSVRYNIATTVNAPILLLDRSTLPSSVAGRFTTDNTSGSLGIDLTGNLSIAPGTVLSCLLLANAVGTEGVTATGVQPIRLVVGPANPKAPSGSN